MTDNPSDGSEITVGPATDPITADGPETAPRTKVGPATAPETKEPPATGPATVAAPTCGPTTLAPLTSVPAHPPSPCKSRIPLGAAATAATLATRTIYQERHSI